MFTVYKLSLFMFPNLRKSRYYWVILPHIDYFIFFLYVLFGHLWYNIKHSKWENASTFIWTTFFSSLASKLSKAFQSFLFSEVWASETKFWKLSEFSFEYLKKKSWSGHASYSI